MTAATRNASGLLGTIAFRVAALATLGIGTCLAATSTCRSDADCSPPAATCRAFSLGSRPQRLCIPPINATAYSTTGADAVERGQEQRIVTTLVALSERVGGLQPKTVAELREVLDREVRAGPLEEATFKRELNQAYAALAQLDPYERLVLQRYLKRLFSTEFERWLFIILDIVRNPDVERSPEVAALTKRLQAEQRRLEGMRDWPSMCAQFPVIGRLEREKIAAELAQTLREIDAQNVPPAQRAALTENARMWASRSAELVGAMWEGACGGGGPLPDRPLALPPMPAVVKSERPRYALYSSDSPEVVVLADAAGIPPVSSNRWDTRSAGKRVTRPPSYAALQPYDADGQSLERRFANTGFFRWFFNMLAENLAVEAIHHYTHIKLDPLPPSMVNMLHVAEQLAKFPDAKTPREQGCVGAALYKELVVPFAPNIGEKIQVMTESVLQLKDPTDPTFVRCIEKK